jgi:GNAT superfamily N-acetyltransferase
MSRAALPEGVTRRAPTPADADAVAAAVAACELADAGTVDVDVEDVRADWRRGSFDLAADAVVVEAQGEIVAHAEVFRGWRAEANVHPAWRGRRIGTWLLEWTEGRARAVGSARVGQTLDDANRGAIALLRSHRYSPRHSSWMLEIDLREAATSPALPEGVTLRDFERGRDDETVYRVIDDAFDEWPDREPSTFDDWAPRTIDWPGFEPWLLPLAVSENEVVGAAHLIDYAGDLGWVNQLAVRRDARNRGIARALLGHAFAEFRLRGKKRCGLSTDSRTGALALYERVGMHVTRSYTHYARAL